MLKGTAVCSFNLSCSYEFRFQSNHVANVDISQGVSFPAVMRTATTGRYSVTQAVGNVGVSTILAWSWQGPGSMGAQTVVRKRDGGARG